MYVYADETMVKNPTISKTELKQHIAKLEMSLYGHTCDIPSTSFSKERKPFSAKNLKK